MPGQLIVDLSSNNHTGPFTWSAIKGAGVQAVVLKATQGVTYTNPFYQADLNGAMSVELPVIAYHYAAFTTPTQEAQHFMVVAGFRARVLDIETDTTVHWTNMFLGALTEPQDQEMTYGSASSLPRGGIRSLLWPADYGQAPGYGAAWQFSDGLVVPGFPTPVDASHWQASDEAFGLLFGVSTPVPPVSLAKGTSMIASTPTGKGYYQVKPTGAVFAWGDAVYAGGANTSNVAPAGQPPEWTGVPSLEAHDSIEGIATCPTGGYWLTAASGSVFCYGGAPYLGGYNE